MPTEMRRRSRREAEAALSPEDRRLMAEDWFKRKIRANLYPSPQGEYSIAVFGRRIYGGA
ncbi:MAG: hypothetical protein JSU06_19730 [Actinobacteria bacterium]|nr:hypothetical protein [Actinomycetota bacterium]